MENAVEDEKVDLKHEEEMKQEASEDDNDDDEFEEEKDAERCLKKAEEDEKVEFRHEKEMKQKENEDNEDKDEISDKLPPHDDQSDSQSTVPAQTPPEIVISSPKEKYDIASGYFLTQIYKPKTKEEEEEKEVEDQSPQTLEEEQEVGLESTYKEKNIEFKVEDKDGNTNSTTEKKNQSEDEEYETNNEDENDIKTDKENEELLDISTKLLLLDMAGQTESQLSPPNSGPGSPLSEEDTSESPTYINLFQDDDLCLLNTGVSPRCSPGNLTPLDPISEQDESEEEEKKNIEDARKISIPSLYKSKLSSGIDNLSALGDEGAEEGHSTSEDEVQKDTEEPPDEGAAVGDTSKRRRRRKGHVTREKHSPIFLNEGVRTFSNPISYFGGPNIMYEEEEGDGGEGGEGGGEGGGRQRDSIISITSLD